MDYCYALELFFINDYTWVNNELSTNWKNKNTKCHQLSKHVIIRKTINAIVSLHRAFPRASTSQKVSVLKNCIVEFKTMYYTYKVLQNKDYILGLWVIIAIQLSGRHFIYSCVVNSSNSNIQNCSLVIFKYNKKLSHFLATICRYSVDCIIIWITLTGYILAYLIPAKSHSFFLSKIQLVYRTR